MFALLVGAQLLALVAMVAVSVWGWKHLEPDTRVRMRGDTTTGLDWTMGRKTILLLRPVVGCMVVIGTLGIRDQPSRELVAGLGAATMVIFLAVHRSSVRRAAR